MSLYDKIKSIYPQLTIEDFINHITLRDDGEGAYIARWEHPTLTQPTEEELAAVT